MSGLSTTQLLDLWERARERPLPDRAVMLVEALSDSVSDASSMPMGRLAEQLLSLRHWAFGGRVDAVARCPQCLVDLELTFDIGELLAACRVQGDPNGAGVAVVREFVGHQVIFRLPTAADLSAAGRTDTLKAGRAALLDRCLLSVTWQETAVPVTEVPDEVIADVESAMAELDPGGDLRVQVGCQECGASWEGLLDPSSFLDDELDSWAQRTLADVAALALAFGWNEPDVLALSATRRASYLELAQR